MDITNKDKASILAALYNNSKAQGMGLLSFSPAKMTCSEAQSLLDTGRTYFDYLKGRVMKVDLSSDLLDTSLYNRDNGFNAAETAISNIE